MKVSKVERDWLRIDAKILRAERELHTMKWQRTLLKSDVLHALGLRGARDELITATIKGAINGNKA